MEQRLGPQALPVGQHPDGDLLARTEDRLVMRAMMRSCQQHHCPTAACCVPCDWTCAMARTKMKAKPPAPKASKPQGDGFVPLDTTAEAEVETRGPVPAGPSPRAGDAAATFGGEEGSRVVYIG